MTSSTSHASGVRRCRCFLRSISLNLQHGAILENIRHQQYQGGGGETRSGTEKRCSHNLQSGHPAWWSADKYVFFSHSKCFQSFQKQEANRQRKSEMLNQQQRARWIYLQVKDNLILIKITAASVKFIGSKYIQESFITNELTQEKITDSRFCIFLGI